MARLFSSGFELNSNTGGVEWTSSFNSPAISTTKKHAGTYALRLNGFGSGSATALAYQYAAGGSGNGPYFFRTYFLVDTAPSAANRIIRIVAVSSTTMRVGMVLNSDLTLQLVDEDGNIGSPSAALSTNTWYYIEIKVDRTPAAGSQVVEAKLNGSVFANSSTRDIASVMGEVHFGANLANEAQTTGDWYFDDIAINDSAGSAQTSYPGAGFIVHLRPSATGDANGFTTLQVGGTAGSANNFTRVDEVTPNDATDYNGANILNAEDLFNVDDPPFGSAVTINLVSVGVRMSDNTAADATAAFKVEVEKTSGGTKSQSAAIIPNSTSWRTNAVSAPRNSPLTLYKDPDSNDWTFSTISSMQIGYIQTVANAQAVAISAIWALVEYVPGAATKTISETLTISDDLLARTGRILTEAITVTATIIKKPRKIFANTISVVDDFFMAPRKIIVNTIQIVEDIISRIRHILTDTIIVTAIFNRVIPNILQDTLRVYDQLIVTFNGIVTALWARVTRSSASWTKQDKDTNDEGWGRQPRNSP